MTGADGKSFFADAMLGRLARWLRVMGYDCAYERHIDDALLARRALAEDRVILTRDRLLCERRAVRGRFLFIEADGIDEQVAQVREAFGIDASRFLTRCLRCNLLLEEVSKDAAAPLVPAYVRDTQERFLRCPGCERTYWGGTHRARMREEVGRLLAPKTQR
ncbi:MAG: Mut7-C RNAse domain-containing protein [Deltaproteobacteria bacterium]|nr:Mut7-C RNAse domain-containing protein [Deltaproteobacteria bacterium]